MTHKYSRRRLQNQFKSFNKRYFYGRLPKDIEIWMSCNYPRFTNNKNRKIWEKQTLGEYKEWVDVETKEICLRDIILNVGLGISADFVEMVLLHEMIHADLEHGGHGPKFIKELRRLMNAGAFDSVFGA